MSCISTLEINDFNLKLFDFKYNIALTMNYKTLGLINLTVTSFCNYLKLLDQIL
jgi:hypothetical protein